VTLLEVLRPTRRSTAHRWACAAAGFVLALGNAALARAPSQPPDSATAATEPLTPIPEPPAADPAKITLGERLFQDPRLSRGNTRRCSTCHDLATNGATANTHETALDGSALEFNTPTIFNAALSFRFGWDGSYRTLEAQAAASLAGPRTMDSSVDEAVGKLRRDPVMVDQFRAAYGRGPDAQTLLDAIVTFERSLLTPGSRFDRWLAGDATALSAQELAGYRLFKSQGCASCHQGVNVGGNLFQRHGIFHPLARAEPAILRVPSLRNVAATPPYFHDGSAPTLADAVRKMALGQLNSKLTDPQVDAIVAYLRTLNGYYRGRPIGTEW
jgi:cytochrome c peroxidase